MNLTTVSKILDQAYSKKELELSFKTTARIFIANNYDFLIEQRISRMELELTRQADYRKEHLTSMCAIPFASKEIFLRFKESLVEEVQKVLDALIWVQHLHQDEIEERLNIKIYTIEQRKMWSNHYEEVHQIKKIFHLFRVENTSGWYAQKPDFQLSLPTGLRRILAQYYDRPENARLHPLETKDKTDYLYETGEQDIQMELPRVMVYRGQNQIAITAKGRPSLSTGGKMQRKLSIKEFFPNTKEKSLKHLRSILIASLAITISERNMDKDMPTLIRSWLFRSAYLNRFESAPMILHYLKGMGYVDSSDMPSVESPMFKILLRLPQNEWVSIENIEDYMRYNVIEIKPILEHTAASKLYYQYLDSEERYYTDKHYIRSGKYRRAILEPFVKGSFFLFAAFGLIDIAYDEPDVTTLGVTAFSPYDGLKYVRLTALGAYVAGHTETYSPPKMMSKADIQLSEDSLSIIVDAEDVMAIALIEPYAERISTTRFQTDFKFFLKDCRSKEELNTKINLFQQFIGSELPPIWENFFTELRQKIDPLEELSEIRIFKIPPDNDKLIHLVARDSELKQSVIKAEGYHLLIPKENYNKFKKRLQEFGYFITN